jgi:hypothetical protein
MKSNCLTKHFDTLRKLLNTISERLSRIQPKVQQLFGVFNRANFTAKTERFIRHLLLESTLVNNRVTLPRGIPFFIYQIRSPILKFFDPSRSPFPRPIQPRPIRNIDNQHRDEAFWQASTMARQQDEAYEWLTHFSSELEIKGELMLSDYFSRIFQDDWARFELVIRFAYLVLQEYSNHPDWQLAIEMPQHFSSYANLQIWTMQIYRKSSVSSQTQ